MTSLLKKSILNYIFWENGVSVFLFPNGIRRVKEIAMMGMGLGPHTYQALSFTFLISFFHRNIFLSRQIWFLMWKLRNIILTGRGLVAPMITFIWSKLSMGSGKSYICFLFYVHLEYMTFFLINIHIFFIYIS